MLKDKVLGGLLGLCVGDALGVPVEGISRAHLTKNPVKNMIGYGVHSQPPGTWSDDSSLALCLAQSLYEKKKVDYKDIANRFVKWLYEGYWTPYGFSFGIGFTTKIAIDNIKRGINPLLAGRDDEYSNGNGSLMRILPLAYYLYNLTLKEQLEITHKVSSITHRHIRSQMSCGIFIQFCINLLKNNSPSKSYKLTRGTVFSYYTNPPYNSELSHFENILVKNIAEIPVGSIKSDGYVIHTLEASLWSLLNSNSYEEAVLKAVNLGYDTDTTGAVTGAMGGLYYGFKNIPEKWVNTLAKADKIIELGEKLYETFFVNNK